ncbi:3-hydroxyacyl-CoA dehydrogenase NAD-binding domain-containing protein [Allorhodopirellula solitaria]|uniref:Fatty acid oxidation complex subunit alpha n=1 Tax=Allorhodopirellula solitaria TaxID=2527987 RepID=A0A5C5WZM2_9BACT|nr:3-hydroxyacyl-CoA dehydrogenase NAD-binding domain-containing protein [Allorhodopirellula solitaria]TWT56088.1 Fatty acid oxidation complex subunit alpha [Allorhodopirellula solitaria]
MKIEEKDYEAFHVSVNPVGVMTVAIDVPQRPMNVFTHVVMDELDSIVSEVESRSDLRLVVFRSEKESGFLAGADVRDVADIRSPSQAGRLIDAGQQLFHRIDHLKTPTLVVIHGPCMGGGLEWALACDYRIARDNSSTKIGLPEIKLGVIPAWGGTQRLPRQVGLVQSLGMILQGKAVSAHQAGKIGLIDRALSPDDWEHGVDRFIDDVLQGRVRTKLPLRKRVARLLEFSKPGRMWILRSARAKIRDKAEQYPALPAAIHAIETGLQKQGAGYVTERSEFVKLLATPTCRNLLNLFFARESARNIKTWATQTDRADIHFHEIRRVGVVGAGAMGAGIGQFAATRGYDVAFREVDESAAQQGRTRVEKLMSSFADRNRLDSDQRRELNNRIVMSTDDDAIVLCDLVVEAAVERVDVKQQIFARLDRLVATDCILATNTSSLSVDAIATATDSPERVAGLHFFNPVHRMELVEVVRGERTNDDTITRLVAFVRSLGKTPIVTKDAPGFLVNRILFPYLGEAILMSREGYPATEIDRELRQFGMPMGPLELVDQVGVDVAKHVAMSLGGVITGLDASVDELTEMVQRGDLGKKSGSGFYQYRDGKAEPADARSHSQAVASQPGDGFSDDGLTAIQRRLVYPMLREAVLCKEQEIVREDWMVDLGMVLATGFAPHRGGPLRVIDGVGARVVHENLKRLQVAFGKRFAPPHTIAAMAETDQRFYVRECTEADASKQAVRPDESSSPRSPR